MVLLHASLFGETRWKLGYELHARLLLNKSASFLSSHPQACQFSCAFACSEATPASCDAIQCGAACKKTCCDHSLQQHNMTTLREHRATVSQLLNGSSPHPLPPTPDISRLDEAGAEPHCALDPSTQFAFVAGLRKFGLMGRARPGDIIEPPCVRVKTSVCALQLEELRTRCPLVANQTEPYPLPQTDPRSALIHAMTRIHHRLRLVVLGDSIYRQVFWELIHLLRGSRLFIDWQSHGSISYVHTIHAGQMYSAVAGATSRRYFADTIERPWESGNESRGTMLRVDYHLFEQYNRDRLAMVTNHMVTQAKRRAAGERTVLILGVPLMWPLIGNVEQGFNSSALLRTVSPGQPLESKVGRFWEDLVRTSRTQATGDRPFQLVLTTPTERILGTFRESTWRLEHGEVLNGEVTSALAALNATDSSDWALVDYAALTRGRCPAASRMRDVPAPGLRAGNWHYSMVKVAVLVGQSWPSRAPQAVSEGFRLPSALVRKGPVSQMAQQGRGPGATLRQIHRFHRV